MISCVGKVIVTGSKLYEMSKKEMCNYSAYYSFDSKTGSKKMGANSAVKHTNRLGVLLFRICVVVMLISLLFYANMNISPNYIQSLPSTKWFGIRQGHVKPNSSTQRRQRKTILLWTNYFSNTGIWLPSTKELKCLVRECDITADRNSSSILTANIMHWRDVNVKDLPPMCTPSDTVQCPLWVLFNKEAPPHTPSKILEILEGKIHWTVTYRRDSDIFAPYGIIMKTNSSKAENIGFKPKEQLICWMVSNCNTPSRREDFVKELSIHVDVHIYGKCGSLQCPYISRSDCYAWLAERCMFYLSLENSSCKDYITEKLYNALKAGMVPVVRGNRSTYSHLPSQSYINANDFSHPKDLAKFLVTVGKNETLYESYMSWRHEYEAKDFSYRWLCELCEKLHNSNLTTVKPRRNLISWWYEDTCAQ